MTQSSALIDDYVFLSGRPPIPEFIGFIKSMAVGGHDIDQNILVSEWHSANDRVRELEQTENGIADNPAFGPIDSSAMPFLDAALLHPPARKMFGALPSEWFTIELDRLVVYQKFINLRYVSELKAVAPKSLETDRTGKILGWYGAATIGRKNHSGQYGYIRLYVHIGGFTHSRCKTAGALADF
jgi:hypothetical protein